ncbi:MAG: hypothetical protein HYV27_06415 [Candidatus Hydrogenedentes bacterium]|nr:hypothetical protein [Candidatus Hydrogenedentota bacterium]
MRPFWIPAVFAMAAAWPLHASPLLQDAARRYDLEAAQAAVAEARVRAAQDQASAAQQELVEALLLVADLQRVDFEHAKEKESAAMQAAGATIDAAAEEGMALAQALPPTSEKYRLLADLQATMIRSKYRAKRYQKRLHEFIDRAVALDEKNARAWVSHAKPLIFADADQGGDLKAGIASLDKALALEPGLESALLLKAHALEKNGERPAAEAIWSAVLEVNPEARPAKEALEMGGK